jgi:hypothetical protein
MMRKNRLLWLGHVVSIFMVLQTSLFAATIKKKNGDVLEGKLEGMIVQREGKESSVTYSIRKGSDVVAIDEQGVTFKKGSKVDMLMLYMEGKSAEEIESLGGKGGQFVRMSGNSDKEVKVSVPLLGEYKGNLNDNEIKGAVIGSIRIKTKTGIITIPVDEIVEFVEKK